MLKNYTFLEKKSWGDQGGIKKYPCWVLTKDLELQEGSSVAIFSSFSLVEFIQRLGMKPLGYLFSFKVKRTLFYKKGLM